MLRVKIKKQYLALKKTKNKRREKIKTKNQIGIKTIK